MCGISTVELCRSCVRLFVPVRAGGVCGGGVCPVPVCFNPVEPWGSQEEFWEEGPWFPLKSFQTLCDLKTSISFVWSSMEPVSLQSSPNGA